MINETGYLRPSYDELLEARIEQAKELFGDDIDTSNSSPLGKFIRLAVQDLTDAYEAQELTYYSAFPHTATGQSLDRLLPFAGITRNQATRAEHKITFTGTAEYEIPVGFLVGTKDGITFYLVNSVTIGSSGTADGIVQCTELGTVGNVKLGAITEIINPDASVSGISHTDIELLAVNEETDRDLRERFDSAIGGSGSGTATAIRGAVMRVNGVNSCVVVENDTNTTDSGGRPAHSFEVYVYAPTTVDQEIAEAIFSKKPLGITSYGTTSKSVTDISGNAKTIKFSHVTTISVYIKVKVATNTEFELNGQEQIKTALISHINSLKAGEDVIYTELYRYLYGVAGVKDVTALSLSTNGTTYIQANITVDQDEVATLSASNVTIEVSTYEDN